MEWLFSVEALAGLLTLTALEIVLGIDNVIFLSILVAKMPVAQQALTRRLGLIFAAVTRIGLLSLTAWMSRMTDPLVTIGTFDLSVRDLILGGGGAFLIVKGTSEIRGMIKGEDESGHGKVFTGGMALIVAEIAVLDIVFSLDSVITAVGMVDHIAIMYVAIIVSTAVMLFAAGAVARFIDQHPTAKMLALTFLLLVGVTLVADGLHIHISRAYLYCAIGFSIGVETLNLFVKRRTRPVVTEEQAPFVPDSQTVSRLVESLTRQRAPETTQDHRALSLTTWR